MCQWKDFEDILPSVAEWSYLFKEKKIKFIEYLQNWEFVLGRGATALCIHVLLMFIF